MENLFIIDDDLLLLPNRAIYIKSIDSLVFADLHLGIEYALALKGIFLPAYQFREIRSIIFEYIKRFKPKKLILVGDLKHEFGQKTRQEHKETIELLSEITDLNLHFILVRGNHDNFIRGVLEKFGVDFRDPIYIDGDFLFIHGHKDIPLNSESFRWVIMGHEHPAVLLRDEVGGKEKFPVFLVGSYPDNVNVRLLVLPALSPVATGVEINLCEPSDFLSPILRKSDIENFRIIVSLNKGVLELPTVGKLREISFL